MINLKYVITGTGRCGTVFLARLLTSLNIPCGHESIFDWNGLPAAKARITGQLKPYLSYCSTANFKNGEWTPEPTWLTDISQIEAEASYLAAPFLKEEILQNTQIIHVTRNPVHVIQSFCNYIDYFQSESPNNKYEQFIYSKLPILTQKMSIYERAALYYIEWNKMIEEAKPIFYRLEDGTQPIIDLIGTQAEKIYSDTTANTYKKSTDKKFAIHMIESQEIKTRLVEMAIRYYPLMLD